MIETPAWIRLALIALGVVLVGGGLLLGWIDWSMAWDGRIRSNRYETLTRAGDPIRFWGFLCISVVLAVIILAAGCRLIVDGVRGFRGPAVERKLGRMR